MMINKYMSQSQNNQDLKVLEFFNNKEKGYFLEIGANDGKTLSNTYLLEKSYKWTGICSEPESYTFEKLKKCRHCICDSRGVFNETKQSVLFEVANDTLYCGISKFMGGGGARPNKIYIETVTLQDLLKEYNAPTIIDFMSLDTEGSELEILKSVDLSEYIFKYILVEFNKNRSDIKLLLEKNMYLFYENLRQDDVFIHESNIIGTYYWRHDYSKPIIITPNKSANNNKEFRTSSSYWKDDIIGIYNSGLIKWSKIIMLPKYPKFQLKEGKIFSTHIEFKNNREIWHRDNRKYKYN